MPDIIDEVFGVEKKELSKRPDMIAVVMADGDVKFIQKNIYDSILKSCNL